MSDADEKRDDSRGKNAPSRHAKFMRGIVTPVLGLLAVLFIVLGILNQTTWAPSTDINATATTSGSEYILTDPGVLDLVDSNVTLTVTETSTGSTDTNNTDANATTPTVCIAVGSAKDAAGWVEGFPYTRITGLNDWSTLSTSNEAAQGDKKTSDTDVAFADSVMWTQHVCSADGQNTVTLNLTNASDTSVAIVDLGTDTGSAAVTMHWTRTNPPNFAMPFYFAAGLFVIAAILAASVFAWPPEKRRKLVHRHTEQEREERRRKKKEAREQEVSIADAVTGTIAVMKPKKRDKSKPRRRHAPGVTPVDIDMNDSSATAGSGDSAPSTPTVVDPGSRNLVADVAAANGSAGDAAGADTAAASATSTGTGTMTAADILAAGTAAAVGETNTTAAGQPADADNASNATPASDAAAASATTDMSATGTLSAADVLAAGTAAANAGTAVASAEEPARESQESPITEEKPAEAQPTEPTTETGEITLTGISRKALRKRRQRHQDADNAADSTSNADELSPLDGNDGETTSVITQDELAAYFARLAQESQEAGSAIEADESSVIPTIDATDHDSASKPAGSGAKEA
ncbi:hypothetical protein [Bifidobacterium choloepi]|uniref:GTPase regulator-like protein n=1 Tax=Bifidobacterium choloepi TaxID=2614131 RepID=A0A6I5N146_9BIFI|nr:hypothetical protein [Bifidobacterium choloepi]NEG70327.1 hypothetical protein [Bifidobacterium choloepi]